MASFSSCQWALERVQFLAEVGQLLLEGGQASQRCVVGLFGQGLPLDLELTAPAREFVDFFRHRVDLDAEARGRLVDQVNRLVREKAAGDVPIGQDGRRNQAGVGDADAVVDLVALLEAAKNADRIFDGWWLNQDRLEAPLERRILLDVLAVLVEGRCSDHPEFATGEHRLEHVRRIHRSFGCARSDDGVHLVDEGDDPSLGSLNLCQNCLESLLELAPILGAGDEACHVDRDDALVLQAFGYVSIDDALGKALDNRGLADSRFSDQHRVVLRSARQHLDRAAYLFVAPDDRIEFALLGEFGEVAAILLERRERVLRVLGRDALAAADVGENAEHCVLGHSETPEQISDRAVGRGQGEEDVLDRYVLVLHGCALGVGAVQDVERGGGEGDITSAHHCGDRIEGAIDRTGDVGRVDVEVRQDRVDEAVGLCKQTGEKVRGFYVRVVTLRREVPRSEGGLLRFLRESVEVHGYPFIDVQGLRRFNT